MRGGSSSGGGSLVRRLGDGRLARPVLWSVALAGALALYAWALHKHVTDILGQRAGSDFDDYYFTARLVLEQHGSVYDDAAMQRLAHTVVGDTWVPVFVYPPLLIVLFLPLAKLAFTTAEIAWLGLNQAFLALSVALSACVYAARGGSRSTLAFGALFALLAAAAYEPTIDHDWEGQSNLLVLVLVAGALYAHLKPRPSDAWTGALLAPAILLKVFPAIFAPLLLVRGRWRALLWTGASAAVVVAVTLLFVPWSDYAKFPQVLAHSMYLGTAGSTYMNYSMAATVAWTAEQLGARGPAVSNASAALRWLPCALVFAMAWIEARREPSGGGGARLAAALRLSEGFILSGFLMAKWWEHHLVLLLPALFFVVRLSFVDRRVRWATRALVAGSVLFLCAGRHPLLWSALDGDRWRPLRDALVISTNFAILALAVAIELSIAELRAEDEPRRLRAEG